MRSRGLVVVVSGAVLMGVVTAPAGAATSSGFTAPVGPPPVEDVPAASAAEHGPVSVRSAPDRTSGSDGFDTARETSTLAPGLTLTEFERYEPEGWLRGDVLTADLAGSGLRPEYLSPGVASARAPLTEQLSGAVAGVNGDFFDIDASGAPLGAAISGGELLSAPAAGHNEVAAVGGAEAAGRLMQVFLAAELTRADGTATPITDLNAPTIAADGIGLYTPYWGGASRTSVVDGHAPVVEVELAGDVVTQVRPAPAEGPVPDGAARLLGVGGGAEALRSLRPGDRATVHYRPRTEGADVAVGGNKVLLRGGEVQPVDDKALHPRTAVGFSADGARMWLVTIDGRQADSRGATERELAERLRALGAVDAINLDGGGSSTLLARERGAAAAEVHNSPSDGELRPVPNGIGFSTAPGSGRLRGFRVDPADGTRVLSGLTRKLTAHGHDESGAPVAAEPAWSVSPPGGGRVNGGVLHAGRPGTSTVTASAPGATGSAELTVLGPPVRLSTDTERVELPAQGSRGRFQVLGHDSEGFETWVEPADVRLEYDRRAVRIEPNGDGFAVTALSPSASSAVTARVGDQVTHLGITTGSRPEPLAPLDGAAGWNTAVFPESVRASLSQAPGHAGTPGLALDYALTGSTTTRAAYVNADQALPLPPGTQRVGVWVNGDGNGAWLRGTVEDAAGVATTVDLARNVDWTGWRYVEAPLPAGAAGALRLQRLYVVEPDGARQYAGRLVFDELTARVAPDVPVPPDPRPRDPAVVQDATLPPAPGAARIAVVSDAQFTADDPDGPLVAQARRSLREAVASGPDALVINGDLVDRGTAADFDLARQMIDSEVGGRVPWYYVPGNHEASGPGDLSEFAAEFGATHQVADVAGSRAVLLDSSSGSLLGGGFGQVRMLRSALDEASRDPRIHSVSVFLHHPLDDPGPSEASELADPKEAGLLNRWLADFERDTGKSAVLVAGHAGVFHSSTVDGVNLEVNGNAGKQPAAAPEDGGFTGWSLLRVDPGDRRGSVRWETRPHVDRIELAVPPLAPDAVVPVTADVAQGDRVVPVRYPVSAYWEGGRSVHIGRPEEAAPGSVAAFDPITGSLTGLRPGRGELSVMVNGVKQSTVFTVTQK
ncbi:phosphodiester glycosidase family protein [Saccharopolyspora gloriosae]|uniref:phosphodiester glycosidase family protein n=1 Tax=Saccharopolyspora gloriosae TaxID=455344 RepID=UPI001FB6DF7C|nr:phosphodiester glycosidase family protein [Saccharopolyspora gloriosae]